MTSSFLRNLRMFEKICGNAVLQNIILTTTMWDEVKLEVGTRTEARIRSKYWKTMIDQGSATARFYGTTESAWDILGHFVRDANVRHALRLQEEMVDLKKQLSETDAGKTLHTEIKALVHRQQASLRGIRDECKLHEDAVILGALKAEYDNVRTQLATDANDMEALERPRGKGIRRVIQI